MVWGNGYLKRRRLGESMTEIELFTALRSGLVSVIPAEIPVIRDYNGENFGNYDKSVMMHLVSCVLAGFTGTDERVQPDGSIVRYEIAVYIYHIQITGIFSRRKTVIGDLTARDVLYKAESYLRSRAALEAFQAQGIGIMTVQQLMNSQFVNDRGVYEEMSHFDLRCSVSDTMTSAVQPIKDYRWQSASSDT